MELANYSNRSLLFGFSSASQVHCKDLSPFPSLLHEDFPPFVFCLGFLYCLDQGKRNKKYFWVPAIAPMISVVVSTFCVFITHANEDGVAIVSAP